MNEGTKVGSKVGQVYTALDAQDNVLGKLHVVVEDLANRIDPITSVATDIKQPSSAPSMTLVPLAAHIDANNAQINSLISRISDLLSRIEL